jgi:hypothetical protein
VKTIIKLMTATAALAAATCFDIPSSQAFGDAPWCAVTERGDGDVHWDCEYHSVEECVPNVPKGPEKVARRGAENESAWIQASSCNWRDRWNYR